MYFTLKDKRQRGKVPPLHCLSRYEGSCGPRPLKMLRCVNERYPPGGRQWPVHFPRTCLIASKVVVYGDLELLVWQHHHYSEITQFASD